MPLSETAPAPGRFSDLSARVKTGVILITGFLILATIRETGYWLSPMPLTLAACLVAFICLDEDWMRGLQPASFRNAKDGLGEYRWRNYGFLYLGLPLTAFLGLTWFQPGLLYLAVGVVVTADIGAYLGGRLIGGPLLWPRISPKKTWAGAIIATFATLTLWPLWLGLRDTFSIPLSTPTLIFLTIGLVWASIGGDLFESVLKRRAGNKDSSTMLPGHGGFLDRLDSHLAAITLCGIIGLIIALQQTLAG